MLAEEFFDAYLKILEESVLDVDVELVHRGKNDNYKLQIFTKLRLFEKVVTVSCSKFWLCLDAKSVIACIQLFEALALPFLKTLFPFYP